MLVVYEGPTEVIVCKKKHEKKMLRRWFKEGGRKKRDYDRVEEREICVVVTARTHTDSW